MKYEIRPAGESDWPALLDLTVRVFVGEGFSTPALEASLRALGPRPAVAELIVAVDSARLLGSVFLVFDGPLRQVANSDEVEIRMLCVEPALRGRGIAEALMQECIKRTAASGRQGIALSTQTTMVAAQRLYQRLGFVRAPARDWKRQNGQPMLAYTLTADPRHRGAV
jgi:ribosomal protein S18 acetylase RimI-like enzyme